jgi:hypothetical protein
MSNQLLMKLAFAAFSIALISQPLAAESKMRQSAVRKHQKYVPAASECSCENDVDAHKVPGVYYTNLKEVTIFDTNGNPAGTGLRGNMITLLPNGVAILQGSAWDVSGSNSFIDSSSVITKGPVAGWIQDNTQQPEFGTWVLDNCTEWCADENNPLPPNANNIRIQVWGYYAQSPTQQFQDMSLLGMLRDTFLLNVNTDETDCHGNYTEMTTFRSTNIQFNYPVDPFDKSADQTGPFARKPGDVYLRVPNFGNDLVTTPNWEPAE